MAAEDSIRDGDLAKALAELKDRVRKDPANAKHRIFLFQLLAIGGDWERSLTQLNVVGEMDASTLPMVQTYREALRCEALRAAVFRGHTAPIVFGQPAEWIALLLEALRLAGSDRQAEAADLRSRAFEAAPATAGTIDGNAFEWIADGDSRLGPMLEAVVRGRYTWIPFHRIKSIRIEPPADLRDLVWLPANFTWANAGTAVGLIPTRYPGSEGAADDALRLARRTEWVEVAEDAFRGLGQRMLMTDMGEHPILDARSIEFQCAEEPAAPPAAEPSGDAPLP